MYSSNDFERLFIRYKAEALPSGESLLSFQVDGRPFSEQAVMEESPSDQKVMSDSVRIMVDIRMSNGIHIQHRNLDFDGLNRLVGNLEVLC